MIKIGNVMDVGKVEKMQKYPKEVIESIHEKAIILDEEYGSERNVEEDLGGYILMIETAEDIESLENVNIYPNEDVAEYVELIVASDCRAFTSSVILIGSDFAVTLIIPLELTPQNLKTQMQS